MAEREVQIVTQAGGPFHFHWLSGREAMGEPYRYEVEFLSGDDELAIQDLLGTGMTIQIATVQKTQRFLYGLVADAAYVGTDGPDTIYAVTLAPWLWFLGRRRDSRTFQNMTVPAILESVFGHWGIADFELKLDGSYPERDYCVQYRESDLDFVTRLMEDEGIGYYFTHRKGGHTLVLTDSPSPHEAVPGYASIPYFPPHERARRKGDHVYDWKLRAVVREGKATLRDFDFEKPKTDLTVLADEPKGHTLDAGEWYDYPGGYRDLAVGDPRSRVRLEELQAGHVRVSGEGNAVGLACGARFALELYPRKDQNKTYLLVATETELASDRHRALRADADPEQETPFTCRFEAQDIAVPFRPARRTGRPFVQGPQTAIVTGPAGEEIHTDKYGRVKVQFHWDRLGKRDQNTSCWVRVSQLWAGAAWGGIHIPRIGHEVIVDFLEGDPDRPIITGRVYNALAMPPYGLPANATQSGIKSDSSKGGGGSNELRFEDKKGGEEVWLHAQKDENIVVENDKTEKVGHDETISIGNDRTETVGHDETMAVGNNRTRNVGVNEAVTVGSNQTISVGSNQTETIGANRADTVAMNEARTVGIAQQQTVGATRNVSVGISQSHQIGTSDGWTIGTSNDVTIGTSRDVKVGSSDSLEVGSTRTTKIGSDDGLTVGANRSASIADNETLSVGKDGTVTIGKNLMITAGDSIEIKTGSAMIIMKKDGSITIKGKDILIDGSGKIDVKASGNITQKGQKILQN